MQAKTSPGGSIFPYYYKGGELFGIHFGSFFSNEDRLITLMKAEAIFFSSQNRSMGVWIDFYQTKLTQCVLQEFIEFVQQIQTCTTKLGIVGCAWIDRWKINRRIKKANIRPSLPVKYFEDPEVAKTWLVSETE
jgi:hypothetical protein